MQQLSLSARPKTLDALIGQEKLVKRIRGHMMSGRMVNAWMLHGPRGCLTGDSLVDCPRDLSIYPDGIPIKELVGHRPWVYAFDRHRDKFVCVQAKGVFKTGLRKPV